MNRNHGTPNFFLLRYFFYCLPFVIGYLLYGCTSYVPARLAVQREGDTLSIALAGPGAARWDPRKDSLVLECAGCAEGKSRMVEHFEDRDRAEYALSNNEAANVVLYSMGHRDSMFLAGTEPASAGTYELRRIPARHYRAAPPAPQGTSVAVKAPTTQKTEKKASSLKVTAAEGVAVYKDKTKREVLKILPQGSTLVLLAREGDLYSVSIDGEEGFVDAEAVQEQ